MRIAVHGGAGTWRRGAFAPAEEAAMRADLGDAALAGWRVLERGASSIDAVTEAVRLLEDSPHYNAGRGSVLNHRGEIEMDAAVMHGPAQAAGAVAALRRVRNPVLAARAVMERSEHVLLVAEGAEAFARESGLELREPAWFHTERRRRGLQRAREQRGPGKPRPSDFSTVGAVALDAQGCLAAATSTGGMTDKHAGRVGDSAVIGAGTWADDRCAVSVTGWGEFCIRAAAAYDIAARLRYAGQTVEEAAHSVMIERVVHLGGSAGAIVLDHGGNLAMPFSTDGMARAEVCAGELRVRLFADE